MSEEKTELERIYEKWDVMRKEAVEDTKFHRDQMDTAFDGTAKIIKWLNRKVEWQRIGNIFENRRKEAYRKAFEFYKTEYNIKLSTKEEYNLLIESDSTYVDFHNKAAAVREIITYIEGVIDNLKGRAWEIKNYLAWKVYSSGHGD